MRWLRSYLRRRLRLGRFDQEADNVATSPLAAEPPSLAQIAYDLRRLGNQRRRGPTQESARWQSAVLRAYDQRLSLACSLLGITEHLEPLEGMDRELERLRVEEMMSRVDIDKPDSTVIVDRPPPAPACPRQTPGSALPWSAPDATAVVLVKIAVTLLPAPDRSRYHEEFLSELFELAATGAQPIEQIVYAARILWQMPALRRELGSPDGPD